MSSSSRRILVSSALPYANGPAHLGHMVEYIYSDIWVRFQKLRGHDCLYVCASDTHGTPIMIKALAENTTPEALIERFGSEQLRDFEDFHVAFDSYHSTHSHENRELVELIYSRLRDEGHIVEKTIRQAYDEQEGMFLPDRYVKGTCPSCGTSDQYGDSCEVCGSTYAPSDLIDPVSVLSDTPPVQRESEHLFFRLGHFADMLREWMSAPGRLDPSVRRKLEEWFEAGLQDWDITRDPPYFGFEVPGHPGKYFYVWLDAPVGYMASFRRLCDEQGLDFDAYWAAGAERGTELYHFIGKDIVYFHALFWPAVLHGSGFRTPSGVFAHGFLTINGQKMSKSRGTFIRARTYLDHLNPECLRYYYAAKLGPGIDDIDLNLDDFIQRVNADLVGKFVNIASRCAGFITKRHGGQLADSLPEPQLYEAFLARRESIAACYEGRDYARAVRETMALADRANQYIDERKPWVMVKEQGRAAEVQSVCTQGLNLFRVLLVYLKPVLPALAARAEAFLGVTPMSWASLDQPLLASSISAFRPLMARVDRDAVSAMVEAERRSAENSGKA